MKEQDYYELLKNTPPTATLIFKDAREKSNNIFKKIKDKLKTVTSKDVFLTLSVILNVELFIAIFRILAVLA